MKLAIASDIHLEFYKPGNYPLLTTEPMLDTILVLAGDIVTADKVESSKWWWEHLSKMFKHVLVVRGNHCFYGGTLDDTRLEQTISHFDNIRLLDNSNVVYEDVAFFGTTLWTDINGGNPVDEIHVKVGFDRSDFRCIKDLSIVKWKAMNLRAREAMTTFFENDPRHKKVIVTHHVPDMSLLHPKWNGSTMNAGFANTGLEEIFYDYTPDLWVNGHTHDGFDKMVYQTRCVCNPMGYKHHEQEQVDNFKLELVEV